MLYKFFLIPYIMYFMKFCSGSECNCKDNLQYGKVFASTGRWYTSKLSLNSNRSEVGSLIYMKSHSVCT